MGAQKTRIGIIGAGAIGCVVGGLLAKAGHDVTLADPWPEHVDRIKAAGLRLSGSCGEHVMKGRCTEIDYLNGFVAAEGRRVGVPTPFNDAAADTFHAHGVGHLKPDPRNLEPLVRLLA